jgi:uroporphyrinogen-III synthase
MGTLPLAGLNIVVTRPREQAVSLQQRITQLGGNVLLFPLLEISPAPDQQALQNAVQRLPGYDLLIFISPNAVRYGMAALRAHGDLPPGLRCAAVGQGSAQALRDAGVSEIIAPHGQSDSEALLALPQLQAVSGWKIAILRGDGGRELLRDTLRARGAEVEYITCYQRSKPQQDMTTLLDAQPHAITLSSSEALGYLGELLDSAARERLAAVPLFVPHARIAAAAHAQGWSTVIQTEGGDDGIVSGLVAWSQTQSNIGTHP